MKRLEQTELIKRLNEVNKLMKGMDVKDLEVLQCSVRGELKLRRLGIE